MKKYIITLLVVSLSQCLAFGMDDLTVPFKSVQSGNVKLLVIEGYEAERLMKVLPVKKRAVDGSLQTQGTISCSKSAQPGMGISTECYMVIKE